MRVKVDISGWLDDFQKHSTIGFSNHQQGAIKLSKELKLEATNLLRQQGKGRAFCKARLYVVALYLLLRPHLLKITHLTLDRDFEGWEGEITTMLVGFFQRHRPEFRTSQIDFANLKKGDLCHKVANGAFKEEFPAIDPQKREFLKLVPVRQKNNRVNR